MSTWGYTRSTTIKPTKKLTKEELAWAAGFLEGEGCFRANKNAQSVQCSQAGSTETLEHLQALFGGGITRLQLTDLSRKPAWLWACYGDRARRVMIKIRHLMSKRRQEQIDKAMQPFYKIQKVA